MFTSCDINRFFDLVSSFARPPKNRSTIFQYKCKFENKGKNRPTQTLRVAFVVASHCRLQIIFLLSQACLKVSKGFSLYVEGFEGIVFRLQRSINICLEFLTTGWNVAKKSQYLVTFWPLHMCKSRLSKGKVDPWQRPFYVFWVPPYFEELFEFQKALFGSFFLKSKF